MDSRNVYQFYLPDLKHKDSFKDTELMYVSHLEATFCISVSRDSQVKLSGLLGGYQKSILLTESCGVIRCYESVL